VRVAVVARLASDGAARLCEGEVRQLLGPRQRLVPVWWVLRVVPETAMVTSNLTQIGQFSPTSTTRAPTPSQKSVEKEQM
jgi:hypothetical protein